MKNYFQTPWENKELVLIAAIEILMIFLLNFTAEISGIGTVIHENPRRSLFLLGIFVVQWVLLLTPILILTWRKHEVNAKIFGFQKIRPWMAIKDAVSHYAFYLAITLIISLVILFTNIQIPGYQMRQHLMPLFGEDVFSLIIGGGVVILFAPIIEEMVFRGFLLRTMVNKIGVWWGSIITAFVFAAFHLQWQSIIPFFILGLIINRLVIKNKSIWPAIAFHILNNGVAFLIEVLIIKEVITMPV